jgi:hypothetical protein
VRRLLNSCVLRIGFYRRTIVLHSSWLIGLISLFSQKHRVSGLKLCRTTLRAAIYFWVKHKKRKRKFPGRFKSGMYRRKIRRIEWREVSKAIQHAFFMLKWNIILGKFSVTNGNSQSPQFNFCHAVKIFSYVKVYIQVISIINTITAEFAIAKKWTALFFRARSVVLLYKHFTYQKGELPCVQLLELKLFFYWNSLVILNEM